MFDVGTSVEGEAFIGRGEEIKDLRKAIFETKNISVSGLSRIGKTSLVKETIRQICSEDLERKPVFFWFSLKRTKEDRERLYKELDAFISELGEEYGEEFAHKYDVYKKRYGWSHIFFLKTYGYIFQKTHGTLYVVIDEMDYAQNSLSQVIQDLREMINSSMGEIRMITVSRHSLRSIFPLGADGSNLPGVFAKIIYIKDYSDADCDLFRQKLEQYFNTLDDVLWTKIKYFCGRVPCLLSIFASTLLEWQEKGKTVQDDLDGFVEEITIKDGIFYSILYYWFQSFCERRLIEDLKLFIYEKRISAQLQSYGIVQADGKLFVPYLEEFVASMPKTDPGDLVNRYIQLKVSIERLIERLSNLANSVQTTDPGLFGSSFKKMQDLRSIELRIDFEKKLMDLRALCGNEQLIVESFASEEECNRMKEFIDGVSSQLDGYTGF